MFNIVLFNPQIPQNTGNIVRTCAVTDSRLHLIKPLGFSINDKHLKRAGLDYWDEASVFVYENFEEFESKNDIENMYLLTTKGDKNYSSFEFKDNDYFMFGSETKGLPEFIHEKYSSTQLRIPMMPKEYARCLNLSNSVCVVLYEALRQTGFKNMG
ncbi:tRNA (uridine(34)/cytosine(34)/5-carboxymethylaminomethyluridine(34)-2'-O)-methyltransferase TrmL [Anaerofustis sp.]|uniref:tRNA (uridine(34)/cytosine(34)/5- carboxymethylaminomethyluridine(34)-2'-O)- methyltransferase TrmL n=1 Tax=Anaerofustis sp. TaxID=1872517 RepID=UPI0025BBCC7E|nr:tRNA (uridine(34)/cytosine(34)/5-carboxymethylaminomethyluridine(34)-2'-O)-methyltransferase TrmL [Anaerofustis sp.]